MHPYKISLKKEIVKTLSDAIDHEMNNDDSNAYLLYTESLKLVATALQQDALKGNSNISVKDKKNLLEFAQQSISRLTLILRKGDCDERAPSPEPSAPTEEDISTKLFGTSSPCKIIEDQLVDNESRILVEKYQKRILSASTAIEKQNLELELARQLVEKMTIVRKKFLDAATFSMETSDRIFLIQEKLASGTLKESDLKKQQLYALSFQYHLCNPAMDVSIKDARATMHGESLVRELINLVMESEGHPANFALNQMHKKTAKSVSMCPHDLNSFGALTKVVKEDLSILTDTLKALFVELQNEKHQSYGFKLVNHMFFSPLKLQVINLLRKCTTNVEGILKEKMETLNETPHGLDEDDKREAITKLHYLTSLTDPYDMIDCAVYVIKLLATSQFDKDHCTSIGADDLLPRLCNVVLSSKLPSIYSEVIFLESFMPSDKALGEGGYAVTMLRSTLAFLVGVQFESPVN